IIRISAGRVMKLVDAYNGGFVVFVNRREMSWIACMPCVVLLDAIDEFSGAGDCAIPAELGSKTGKRELKNHYSDRYEHEIQRRRVEPIALCAPQPLQFGYQ